VLRRFPSGDRALWLAQPKSIPFSDELYDLPDIGIGLKILFRADRAWNDADVSSTP